MTPIGLALLVVELMDAAWTGGTLNLAKHLEHILSIDIKGTIEFVVWCYVYSWLSPSPDSWSSWLPKLFTEKLFEVLAKGNLFPTLLTYFYALKCWNRSGTLSREFRLIKLYSPWISDPVAMVLKMIRLGSFLGDPRSWLLQAHPIS